MLTADDRFCPTCGQKTDTHRLNMGHIWHDLIHAFTHADKGFLFTLRELIIRPGIVAREYVSGKRKKYFNPFSFLFIVMGVYLVANGVFKPYSANENQLRQVQATLRKESQRQKYQKMMERRHHVGEFMNNHTNVVLFVSTPFIAFILWLLFRKRKIYYAEHLTTMAYVNGVLAIFTIVIFGPLIYFARGTPAYTPVYMSMMVTHVVYLAAMYYGFIGYTRKKDFLRALGAAVIAILSWALLTMVIIAIYVARGIMF
jgi:hypothetical protein